MNEKDFSEVLNNSKDLTIGQIIKLLSKIKYKTIALFVSIFLAITGSAYMAGKASVEEKAAVMLHSPFSMRILINNKQHDFNNLTLIQDPILPPPSEDKVSLSLRQIVTSFDIIPIGQVIARINITKSSSFWEWVFAKIEIKSALAQEAQSFDWNGHGSDFEFIEKQIDEHTMNRYYSDECILEYKITKNKRSIPSSFRWLNRAH